MQCWGSYFGKVTSLVTSYSLLSVIPSNLVTLTGSYFFKSNFYIIVTSYFYMLIIFLTYHIFMIFMS